MPCMKPSIRLLGIVAFLAIAPAVLLSARDGHPVTAPAAAPQTLTYRSGTVILKLHAWLRNDRSGIAFGLPALDAVITEIGGTTRDPLFPLVPIEPSIPLPTMPGTEPAGYDRVYVLHYNGPFDALAVSERLRKTGMVDFAEPYYIFPLAYAPNDPQIAQQYWLSKIEAEKAWDITKGDSSIIIGVVDTGVDWLHEDLKDNIAINKGETGIDANGKDKRTNGKDDDG